MAERVANCMSYARSERSQHGEAFRCHAMYGQQSSRYFCHLCGLRGL